MSNFECAADSGYVVPFNPEDSFPALDYEIKRELLARLEVGRAAVTNCGGVETFPPVFDTPPAKLLFAEYPTYL